MATLKRGARLPRGSYLEIEIDGVMWRITKGEAGSVRFEVKDLDGFIEVDRPPQEVELLWELIESDAAGNGPH